MELIWYLRGKGFLVDEEELNRSTLRANNANEVSELLECVLGQWADFAFLSEVANFAIYADHDEYTTIFTQTQQQLLTLKKAMIEDGFKEVKNWMWTQSRHSL